MPSDPDEPDYFGHAFKSQYNVIALATAGAFALLSGTLLPIIVAAGAEMVLLPLLTSIPGYKRLVRLKRAQELAATHNARQQNEASHNLQYLPDRERDRYRALQQLCADIRENYAGLDATSRVLVDELVGKLDFLLAFYLRMRVSLMRYRDYFASTDQERIQERIAMLDHEAKTCPPRVAQIKARTRSVLEKRLERFTRASENRQLVEAQTETVEEVLRLLRDQSFAMSDPKSITEQLDGLVSSAEETERGVRDIEEILSMEQDAFSPTALGPEVVSELGSMAALGGAPRGAVRPQQPGPRPVPRNRNRG